MKPTIVHIQSRSWTDKLSRGMGCGSMMFLWYIGLPAKSRVNSKTPICKKKATINMEMAVGRNRRSPRRKIMELIQFANSAVWPLRMSLRGRYESA